jgi:hypothetical protein
MEIDYEKAETLAHALAKEYFDRNATSLIPELVLFSEEDDKFINTGASMILHRWGARPGGGFVSVVAENDLREALFRADDVNKHAIEFYVRLLYNTPARPPQAVMSEAQPEPSSDLPFVAIGNGELDGQPDVKEGDIVIHTNKDGSQEECAIEYGHRIKADGSKEKSSLLGYYKTKDGTTYMASLNGKLMPRTTLRVKS